jgi:CheY-like chemotaxis protein
MRVGHGEGCVLVAVEDPELRRQICDPLRGHGFDVVEAASATAALELV